MIRPTRQTVTLESVREETPEVRTFVFSTDYDFEPGQFVNVRFADDDVIGRRSFSIASGPGERLELTIKAIGTFTRAIFDAPIGTTFEVLGPLGLPYVRSHREDPYLIVTGGTGIAPFRSLMRDERLSDLRFTIIDSNRTEQDIVYRDEMDAWNARIIHTLTRAAHHELRNGRIDRSIFESIENIASHRVLVCGPPGLVSAAIEHLTSLGIPMERIKTESWGT